MCGSEVVRATEMESENGCGDMNSCGDDRGSSSDGGEDNGGGEMAWHPATLTTEVTTTIKDLEGKGIV